jgi:hypothetical protein
MMAQNLIGPDIIIMRKRYDEALLLRGIPAKYQHPLMASTNAQGEPVVEAYSEFVDTHIFFDGNPKIKTFKRYGWVVENDDNLPFLIHCSFNLPHVQRDSLFTIAGQYSELPDRVFRVTEITMDMQAPDHLIVQVVPVYDKQTVGRTDHEVKRTFNTSNHFLNPNVDYRGQDYIPSEESKK